MKLFSPAWNREREAIAHRMAAQADERRAQRRLCIKTIGKKTVASHAKPDETFVVPPYLNSAGLAWEHCPRCGEWWVPRD